MLFSTIFSILTYSHPRDQRRYQPDCKSGSNWEACWMQGRRSYMEDRISITDFADANGDKVTVALVYDGHGGHEVSEFSRKWFPTYLINQILINYTSMDLLDEEKQNEIMAEISNACLGMFYSIRSVLTNQNGRAFAFFAKVLRTGFNSGSTVTGIIQYSETIIVLNIGDSKTILTKISEGGIEPESLLSIVYGNPHKENVTVFESVEHKPDSEGEYKRIKNAGHYVTPARQYSNGMSPARVSGSLALSRAFGDFYLKTWIDQRRTANAVSAEPDIQIIPRNEVDGAIIISDGVFETISFETIQQFLISEKSDVTRNLLRFSFQQQSGDNMAIIKMNL